MKKFLILFLLVLLISGFLQIKPLGAAALADRLSGKILLQVEANGEAWYVNPEKSSRYFLGRPADAFNIMRKLGLGVSNQDFDLFGDKAPARLAGKILLKVEENGEAYYVDPGSLNMHYLGRPADAFNIMRSQGLGITNNDLAKITIEPGFDVPSSGSTETTEPDNIPSEEPPLAECPQAACSDAAYQGYSLENGECVLAADDCSDCSCDCGGYNNEESLDNNNCEDQTDNDCDGIKDSEEAGCTRAGLDVSANITENISWKKESGPYKITGDIIIEKGVILTIEPGTMVEFAKGEGQTEFGGYTLTVEGELTAIGTSDNLIVLTSGETNPNIGDWGTIEVINGGTVNFDYINIEYADTGLYAPNAKNISVKRSNISQCTTAIFITGPADVSQNVLENNQAGLVYSGDSDSLRDDGTYLNFDRISNIANNTIRNNVGEVLARRTGGVVVENLTTGGFRLIFKFNNIVNNIKGISFVDSDFYNLMEVEKNNFIDNTDYNVYLSTQGTDINLERNWWGTIVLDELDALVYDFYDVNTSLPKVDYKPFEPGQVEFAGATE